MNRTVVVGSLSWPSPDVRLDNTVLRAIQAGEAVLCQQLDSTAAQSGVCPVIMSQSLLSLDKGPAINLVSDSCLEELDQFEFNYKAHYKEKHVSSRDAVAQWN